ncbi:hypothetical protein [Dokdonella soli]|uniref:TetR/AcrR family transcriptional regulator n=1 Tax=Dokdonella soli TaxID=529810 RepID=A0ABP3TRA8_9GAMM
MIDILNSSADVLVEAGFTTTKVAVGNSCQALAFENATVLGFLFIYEDASRLMLEWNADADRVISAYQFGLRRAGLKAWNTYIVLLSSGAADYAQTVSMGTIEEDLAGTRKIARAGVNDIADLHAALLPLLALQSAPRLEAVNIADEIRQRTTELPSRTVDAFLSGADEAVVMQVLEETP